MKKKYETSADEVLNPKTNPAAKFITAPTAKKTPAPGAAAKKAARPAKKAAAPKKAAGLEKLIASASSPPPGYKLDPRFIELKSKDVHLLIQPSLYGRIAAAAEKAGARSFNDYVHKILERDHPESGKGV
jgi:hypothetical protein